MSQARLDIIDQAFRKMDKTGDGVITVADLMNTFDVSRHPKFISGERTKEQIIKKYLDVFQRNDTDDEVCVELMHCHHHHHYLHDPLLLLLLLLPGAQPSFQS